jgi:hypothetical protein
MNLRFFTRALLVILLTSFTIAHPTHTFAASNVVHVSHNWAGYAAPAGTYTGVTGSWIVPQSSSTNGTISADAAWIGIGGLSTKDLIQAGTQAVFTNGRPAYQAWVETLPDAQRILPLAIAPGDLVTITLEERKPNVWHLTFANRTTGKTYEADIPYVSSRSSAEWVVERPLAQLSDGSTTYLALSNFGSLQIFGAATLKDGSLVSLSAAGAEPLYMAKDDYYLLATTSEARDTAFSVTYLDPFQGRAAMRNLQQNYHGLAPVDAPIRIPAFRAPVTTVTSNGGTVTIQIMF